ncbi:MAG TPA: ribosome maturation factor RimP [Thermoanaerobaculia bacterium]|nr:ribosome maturation factor RimP [Thermoanaerobaculia bacterium]HUM29562.1 ribosome maturation factor RimP [Thermoanaerobaculia bacterium]HXK67945.1 ribosome maturation factor RimP [Thermoanaerobaculia bacterium]
MLPEKVMREMKEAVRDLGYDLVHVEWKGGRGRGVLRLFIERDEGITLSDCERVSREISALLDVLDPISHSYSLEVSSPGVERPIFHESEYPKFVGRPMKVTLTEAVEGTRVLHATLESCKKETLTFRRSSGTLTVPKRIVRASRLLGPWEEVD